MRARLKSTGEIVNVFSLGDPNDWFDEDCGKFYTTDELDFWDIEHFEVPHGGWVTRNENGQVMIWQDIPKRKIISEFFKGYWEQRGDDPVGWPLPEWMFPELKWEDEPKKVDIIIKM